jgi:hypothetical protein
MSLLGSELLQTFCAVRLSKVTSAVKMRLLYESYQRNYPFPNIYAKNLEKWYKPTNFPGLRQILYGRGIPGAGEDVGGQSN